MCPRKPAVLQAAFAIQLVVGFGGGGGSSFEISMAFAPLFPQPHGHWGGGQPLSATATFLPLCRGTE